MDIARLMASAGDVYGGAPPPDFEMFGRNRLRRAQTEQVQQQVADAAAKSAAYDDAAMLAHSVGLIEPDQVASYAANLRLGIDPHKVLSAPGDIEHRRWAQDHERGLGDLKLEHEPARLEALREQERQEAEARGDALLMSGQKAQEYISPAAIDQRRSAADLALDRTRADIAATRAGTAQTTAQTGDFLAGAAARRGAEGAGVTAATLENRHKQAQIADFLAGGNARRREEDARIEGLGLENQKSEAELERFRDPRVKQAYFDELDTQVATGQMELEKAQVEKEQIEAKLRERQMRLDAIESGQMPVNVLFGSGKAARAPSLPSSNDVRVMLDNLFQPTMTDDEYRAYVAEHDPENPSPEFEAERELREFRARVEGRVRELAVNQGGYANLHQMVDLASQQVRDEMAIEALREQEAAALGEEEALEGAPGEVGEDPGWLEALSRPGGAIAGPPGALGWGLGRALGESVFPGVGPIIADLFSGSAPAMADDAPQMGPGGVPRFRRKPPTDPQTHMSIDPYGP